MEKSIEQKNSIITRYKEKIKLNDSQLNEYNKLKEEFEK